MYRDGFIGLESSDMKDEAFIYSQLTDIFNDVFDRSDMQLYPEMSAKDVPDWDSFKQVELIVTIQDRLGIKLSTRDVDGLKCVADLARVVREKI